MEAFFQVAVQFRSKKDVRIYRSINSLLWAIEAMRIYNSNNGLTYEVKLFTDHEAWREDFSQEELAKTIHEIVDEYGAIPQHEYMDDGKTIAGTHPDLDDLTKEWKVKSRARLRAIVQDTVELEA